MTHPGTEHDPLDALIEDFLARHRRGEAPSPDEYADRHPELADHIRNLFPALVTLERLGSVVGGSPAGPAEPVGPGTVLGEYRLLREVGRGGMGVVYEAVQETLGRPVALKVMAVGATGAGRFLDRFRREARTAARLHHTNIVPVFGVGADEGVYFYAMQFIRGQSLSAVLDEVRRLRSGSTAPVAQADTPLGDPSSLSRQPPEHYYREVARLAAQAADALAYAHAQGVLHRDVKPSNLLLDAGGSLWVADFGLAKADDADDLTETGNLVGTPRYMAPERFRGPGDARSDVYSLGTTLYEMLTLRPAFDAADRVHLVEQIAAGRPTPPRRLDPEIPRDLETVVLHAMAREPADRYATAAALADDLRNVLADRPVSVRRPTWAAQGARWARRNPVVAGLAAAVFALLLAVAGVTEAKNRDLRAALKDKDDALDAKGLALGEKDTALGERLVALKEKDNALRVSLVEQARSAMTSGDEKARSKALKALTSAAAIRPDPDLRSEVIAALDLDELSLVRKPTLAETAAFVQGLGFPDGFVQGFDPGTPGPGGTRIIPNRASAPISAKGPRIAMLLFESDGRQQLRSDDRRTWHLYPSRDAKTPSFKVAEPLHLGPHCCSITSSGKLVLIDRERMVRVYNARTGAELAAWGPIGDLDTKNIVHAVDPKGEKLVAIAAHTGLDFKVEVRELATGTLVASPPLPAYTRFVPSMAFDPKSELLAVANSAGNVYIFDVRTSYLKTVLPGRLDATAMKFHPTREILLVGDGQTLRLWNYMTDRLIASTTTGGPALDLCISKDGRYVGWAGGVRVVELGLSRECRRIDTPRKLDPGSIAFSRDGRYVACGTSTITTGMLVVADTVGEAPAAVSDDCHTDHVVFDHTDDGVVTASRARQQYERLPVIAGPGAIVLGSPSTRLHPAPAPKYQPHYLVAASSETRTLAFVMPDKGEILVEAAGRAPGLKLRAENLVPGTVRVSPNGRYLGAVCSTRGAFHLTIWDLATGREVLSTPAVFAAGLAGQYWPQFEFSRDGERFVAFRVDQTPRGSRAVYRLHQTSDGVVLGEFAIPFVRRALQRAFALSPDGNTLAVHLNGRTHLISTPAMTLQTSWDETREVFRLAFSPDGRRLVLAGDGITIRDLRLVRKRLREMGLDWDDPPPPAL